MVRRVPSPDAQGLADPRDGLVGTLLLSLLNGPDCVQPSLEAPGLDAT
jgi:hypothetical protein